VDKALEQQAKPQKPRSRLKNGMISALYFFKYDKQYDGDRNSYQSRNRHEYIDSVVTPYSSYHALYFTCAYRAHPRMFQAITLYPHLVHLIFLVFRVVLQT
jgi:hypothetical protein